MDTSEVTAVSLPDNFASNQQRLEEAKRERYRVLQKVQDLCTTGQRSLVIPFLMVNMQHNPALKKIRLWQLDAIMFNQSKYIALKTIRHMRETIGDQSTVKDGYADLGWALENKNATVRMTTWLYQLLEREKTTTFELPEGFPLTMLYETGDEN